MSSSKSISEIKEKTMSGMARVDLHSTTDAQVWAEEFVRTLRENPETADPYDEGFMIGWFANALMAEHDAIANDPVRLRGMLASIRSVRVSEEPLADAA